MAKDLQKLVKLRDAGSATLDLVWSHDPDANDMMLFCEWAIRQLDALISNPDAKEPADG